MVRKMASFTQLEQKMGNFCGIIRLEAELLEELRIIIEPSLRDEGIDAVLKANNLDALVFPGVQGAAIAAKAGYPTIVVPFGMVPNAPMPPGFDAKPSPMGVSFTGTACSEPRLIEIAYAFEQATKKRVPPKLDATCLVQEKGASKATAQDDRSRSTPIFSLP